MTTVTDQSAIVPIPRNITTILRGLWSVGTIKAAVNLNLFDAMAEHPKTAAQVANICHLDSRACEVFLNALSGLELVIKQNNMDNNELSTYSLTDEASVYLVSGSPLYMGDYIKVHSKIQKHWSNLEAVAKSGEPLTEVNKDDDAQSFFPELAASLYSMNYGHASRVKEKFQEKILDAKSSFRVLDLAAGSAVWSIPIAKVSESVKVDALDFAKVIEVTKGFVEGNGLTSQYSYLEGNWRDIDLVPNSYDMVILGHILHSEGRADSEALLDKVSKILKPGGSLVIAEFVVDETGTKPSAASMFAINMFILTTKGCVFSEAEIVRMLETRGLKNCNRLSELPYESLILLAEKA